MSQDRHFIIDFDSTITRVEALDELAAISLKGNPEKERILKNVQAITRQGMEGSISFAKSLSHRVKLLKAGKSHIAALIRVLRKKLSRSFVQNKEFFRQYRNNIYIVSGGFKEYIVPVLEPYGILKDHIFANNFIFSEKGDIAGVDKKNRLAQKNGKAKLLKEIKLKGEIHILGDGYTDYEIKKSLPNAKFFAFTENVQRKSVIQKADFVVRSFDEYLYVAKLPMSISYPKNRIKFLLLEDVSEHALSTLRNEGFSVEAVPHALTEQELSEKIKDVSVLGVRSCTNVTDRVLENSKRLLAIGAFCIGTNNINLISALRKGIPVFNAPYSNTRSVAELIIGEIVMLIRGIFDRSQKLHRGIWEKTVKNSSEARGKKLGIIGYGNIGSQVSVLAEGLGMEVYYFDILDKLALGNAKKCKTMRELIKKSDIITVHVDGNPRNVNLIGSREFERMKDGIYFINSSRGNVVDLKSLAENIKTGKIRGAAIDVFPKEPKSANEKFISILKNLPNTILTPHIGGSTRQAQENIARFVSERLIGYINAGDTIYSVNFPQIKLPTLKNSHRFLHIHKNIPGMLSRMNTIFASNNINIESQYLKTNEEIGYVITDVYSKYDKKIIDSLKSIPDTIKFRVLY